MEVSSAPNNKALNCVAKWVQPDSPFNRKWACDETGDGYWTMEVIKTASGEGVWAGGDISPREFNLTFTRNVQKPDPKASLDKNLKYYKLFEGHAQLNSENMAMEATGKEGTEIYTLKKIMAPFNVWFTESPIIIN